MKTTPVAQQPIEVRLFADEHTLEVREIRAL